MIKNAYHYLYFRTYQVILRTNEISTVTSAARFLSLLLFVNIMSFYLFFNNIHNSIAFYVCGIFGFIMSILNLRYFSPEKSDSVIFDFKNIQVNVFYRYLVDSYPYLSFLILLISLDMGYKIIFYYLGLLILIKLVNTFWKA